MKAWLLNELTLAGVWLRAHWLGAAIVFVFGFLGGSALAANTAVVTETPGTTTAVYRGTTSMGTVPDYAACKAAATADAVARNPGTYSYGCQDARDKLSIKVTTAPVTPPVVWTHFMDALWPVAGQFTVHHATQVRFGAGTTWDTKSLNPGTYPCDGVFFKDLLVGQAKTCETTDTTAVSVVTAPVTPPVQPPTGNLPIIPAFTPVVYHDLRIMQYTGNEPANPASDGVGAFRNPCLASHMLFDDPIVYPGVVGGSHLHLYFGNPSLNANSTTQSLTAAAASTCAGGVANLSSYWIPAMIDTRTNTALVPGANLIYYKSGYNNNPLSSLVAPPTGLKAVAGAKMGDSGPSQSPRHSFECWDRDGGRYGRSQFIPVACPQGGYIELLFEYPNCWNGQLDSTDHRSHMAYSNDYADHKCPATHPQALPVLSLNIRYDIRSSDNPSKYWRLSSDMYDTSQPGGYTMHADVWINWQTDIRDTWMANCVRKGVDGHGFLLCDGRTTY